VLRETRVERRARNRRTFEPKAQLHFNGCRIFFGLGVFVGGGGRGVVGNVADSVESLCAG